jgi:hypothetical protein
LKVGDGAGGGAETNSFGSATLFSANMPFYAYYTSLKTLAFLYPERIWALEPGFQRNLTKLQ